MKTYACDTWRTLPAGAHELVQQVLTTSPQDDETEGFMLRYYEHGVRLQGWEPIEGTAHLHEPYPAPDGFSPDFWIISVHGLGKKAADERT